MLTELKQDVHYAVRMLRRARGFTAVAVATLALGIGATTAIFSLANWTIFRPVAGVAEPDRVAVLWTGRWISETSFRPSRISYPNFADIVPTLRSVAGLAGYQAGAFSLATGREPARTVTGEFVTASYFDVLDVPFRAGRAFTAAEDNPSGAAPVAVISDHLWASLYQRDARAFVEPLRINGVVFTVVGVVGAGFQGTQRVSDLDVWVPGATYPLVNHMPSLRYDQRNRGGYYEFVARLAADASWEQVRAEFGALGPWLADRHPDDNAGFKQSTFHMFGPIGLPPMPGARTQLRSMLGLMMGASAIVLLIACANVANLLMLRGLGRRSEVAVRMALGATRSRLIRQHLTEGLCLWALGGAAATLVVYTLSRRVGASGLLGARALDGDVPIDWRVAIFSVALSLLVGVVFSLVPAFRAARAHAAEALRDSRGTAPRSPVAGSVLTVVQLSSSLALLVAAFLLSGTLRHLASVPLGFDPEDVTTFRLAPSQVGYSEVAAFTYIREFARRLEQVPGVESVALAQAAPFGGQSSTRVRRQGATSRADVHETLFNQVGSTAYFSVLRIPLLRGRYFETADLPEPGGRARPVVILSDNLARRIFGSIDVVGQSLEFPVLGREKQTYEVIGVVGTTRFSRLTGEDETMLYEPVGAGGGPIRGTMSVLVRARPGRSPADAIREIAGSLNSALPVGRIAPVTEEIDRARQQWTGLARLLEVLAAVATILAAVGLYGVIAFGVAQRRRELGIRMALGAPPAGLVAIVLRRSAVITGAGLAFGTAGAGVLGRALESRLVGVTPFDPAAWGLAMLALTAIAFAASAAPAYRATQVDVRESLITDN